MITLAASPSPHARGLTEEKEEKRREEKRRE